MISSLNSNSFNYSNMQTQRPRPPQVDTNGDDNFDLSELEALSEKQAEKLGTTFDAEEVMTKYDANSDGLIDASERVSLKEDNAFNMPSPQEIGQQMMANGRGRPQGPPPGGMNQESSEVSLVEELSEDLTSDLLALLEELEDDDSSTSLEESFQEAILAYTNQVQYESNLYAENESSTFWA